MKKFIAFMLTLVLMLPLVACGYSAKEEPCLNCGAGIEKEAIFCKFCGAAKDNDSSENTKPESNKTTDYNTKENNRVTKEEKLEFISINDLVDSLDNMARAQIHIGKATYLFGRIESIGTHWLGLEPLFIEEQIFSISMDPSVLANYNTDEYLAIYAVVNEINDFEGIVFDDCKPAAIEKMDQYIIDALENSSASSLLRDRNNLNHIFQYVHQRGDVFQMKNDAEISSWVIGLWDAYSLIIGSNNDQVAFLPDGEYLETYTNTFSNNLVEYSWSVQDGNLTLKRNDSSSYNPQYVNPVYKITDNVMIIKGMILCIRNTEI